MKKILSTMSVLIACALSVNAVNFFNNDKLPEHEQWDAYAIRMASFRENLKVFEGLDNYSFIVSKTIDLLEDMHKEFMACRRDKDDCALTTADFNDKHFHAKSLASAIIIDKTAKIHQLKNTIKLLQDDLNYLKKDQDPFAALFIEASLLSLNDLEQDVDLILNLVLEEGQIPEENMPHQPDFSNNKEEKRERLI